MLRGLPQPYKDGSGFSAQPRFLRLLGFRRTGPPAPELVPTPPGTSCGTLPSSRSSVHLLHVYAPMNLMYAQM
jgi:hypothetical protein